MSDRDDERDEETIRRAQQHAKEGADLAEALRRAIEEEEKRGGGGA